MSGKKVKNKTVSEKIAETFLPKALADPENDSENETLVKIADFDEEGDGFEFESKPSDIRKRNTKLLSDFSDKYKGKVSIRRELEEEEEDSDELASEESDGEELEEDGRSVDSEMMESRKDKLESSSEEEEGEDDDGEEEDESENDGSPAEQDDNDPESKILTETNENAEIQKGLAVQNQLKLWEKLLEIRIHSQKMLNKANSLPLPALFQKLSDADSTFTSTTQETVKHVATLLANMLDLQHTLIAQYPETKTILKSNRKRTSQTQFEAPVKRFATTLSSDFESFRPYRNSVLQKWDDRAKILTPGAGAAKGKTSLAENFDVVRKIEAVLLNKSDLVTKSRTLKGAYQLFGTKSSEQAAAATESDGAQPTEIISREIYDDTDFYHQQLRELIEFKSNTTSNPAEMTKQFAELQKLRQKMKKKVDTRASKGRKIRYVVHNKLVNFMAPDPHSDWTEDSKTELCRSLFAT